jgi:hypothetical protein
MEAMTSLSTSSPRMLRRQFQRRVCPTWSSNLSSERPIRIRTRVRAIVLSWPNKSLTKLDVIGQHYQIPPDSESPEIDCYAHMSAWLSHLQLQSQRPLFNEDFIFPAIASTGHLKFGEPMSRSGFESLMDDIIEQSGVMEGRHGKFTTHCFRRGGAQYRFMWAHRKWSLKAVKWWGGWSSSENVSPSCSLPYLHYLSFFFQISTIMQYLLDELMAYEEGFSDIMMGDRASDRHETFMGSVDPSAAVSKGDLLVFEKNLLLQVRELLILPIVCDGRQPGTVIGDSGKTTSARFA